MAKTIKTAEVSAAAEVSALRAEVSALMAAIAALGRPSPSRIEDARREGQSRTARGLGLYGGAPDPRGSQSFQDQTLADNLVGYRSAVAEGTPGSTEAVVDGHKVFTVTRHLTDGQLQMLWNQEYREAGTKFVTLSMVGRVRDMYNSGVHSAVFDRPTTPTPEYLKDGRVLPADLRKVRRN